MPGVDVDPTDSAPRDFNIEAPSSEVRADGFLTSSSVIRLPSLPLGPSRGGVGFGICCTGWSGGALTIFPSGPVNRRRRPRASRRRAAWLTTCLCPTPQPLRQHVIVQRRVTDRLKNPVSQGRHEHHRGTDLRRRSRGQQIGNLGEPPHLDGRRAFFRRKVATGLCVYRSGVVVYGDRRCSPAITSASAECFDRRFSRTTKLPFPLR